MHPGGVEEVVADKGYHSNDVALGLAEIEVRTYMPDRGQRNWDGKAAEKAGGLANRRGISGHRGKRLQRQRRERIERNVTHQFDTGGLDRLYVRGIENVHKKFRIQAAACNLALLMRSMYGSGKRAIQAILTIFGCHKSRRRPLTPRPANSLLRRSSFSPINARSQMSFRELENGRFRHGQLSLCYCAAAT